MWRPEYGAKTGYAKRMIEVASRYHRQAIGPSAYFVLAAAGEKRKA